MTLCQVNYRRAFRDQLSDAVDIYLAILHHIQQRIDQLLGRDAPDWHLKHGCPCCGHTVQDEPRLIPARLHAMDGNSSAKRLAISGNIDPRNFNLKFFLSPEYVDEFQDEVRSSKKVVDCTTRFKAVEAVDNPETVKIFEQTGIFLTTCRHHIIEIISEMRKSGEL
jgi:hypothetical protein